MCIEASKKKGKCRQKYERGTVTINKMERGEKGNYSQHVNEAWLSCVRLLMRLKEIQITQASIL